MKKVSNKQKLKSFSDSDIGRNEVTNQEAKIEKENTRPLMRALPGGRKNCRECREEEEEYYPETKIIQKSCLKS